MLQYDSIEGLSGVSIAPPRRRMLYVFCNTPDTRANNMIAHTFNYPFYCNSDAGRHVGSTPVTREYPLLKRPLTCLVLRAAPPASCALPLRPLHLAGRAGGPSGRPRNGPQPPPAPVRTRLSAGGGGGGDSGGGGGGGGGEGGSRGSV